MTLRFAALVFGLALSAACAPAVAAIGKTLEKIDTKVGSGRQAMTGNVVTIHYTGWLHAPNRPAARAAAAIVFMDNFGARMIFL